MKKKFSIALIVIIFLEGLSIGFTNNFFLRFIYGKRTSLSTNI